MYNRETSGDTLVHGSLVSQAAEISCIGKHICKPSHLVHEYGCFADTILD